MVLVIVIIPTVTISVQTFIAFHLDVLDALLAISLSVIFCLSTITSTLSPALSSYPVQSFPSLETSVTSHCSESNTDTAQQSSLSSQLHVQLYPSTSHRLLLLCKTTLELDKVPHYNTNCGVIGSSPVFHLDEPKVLAFQDTGRKKGSRKLLIYDHLRLQQLNSKHI